MANQEGNLRRVSRSLHLGSVLFSLLVFILLFHCLTFLSREVYQLLHNFMNSPYPEQYLDVPEDAYLFLWALMGFVNH